MCRMNALIHFHHAHVVFHMHRIVGIDYIYRPVWYHILINIDGRREEEEEEAEEEVEKKKHTHTTLFVPLKSSISLHRNICALHTYYYYFYGIDAAVLICSQAFVWILPTLWH